MKRKTVAKSLEKRFLKEFMATYTNFSESELKQVNKKSIQKCDTARILLSMAKCFAICDPPIVHDLILRCGTDEQENL